MKIVKAVKVNNKLFEVKSDTCSLCQEDSEVIEINTTHFCFDCLSEFGNKETENSRQKAVTLKDVRPDWDGDLTWVGYLDLRNTPITELPDNLIVGDSLYLSNTNITKLPNNLTVGGSLSLSYTQITEPPDNLTVGGHLYLSNTNIKELPDNLKVGGDLYLSNTNIKELPDNLTVGGKIYVKKGQLTYIPKHLKNKVVEC